MFQTNFVDPNEVYILHQELSFYMVNLFQIFDTLLSFR